MLTLVKILLLPVTAIYAIIITIRNLFFDINVYNVCKSKSKIISVGNINLGGSGKTPLSIYIIELLKKMGKNPAALSRGYRRNSKGYLLVSDGQNIFTSVEDSGDEILQTALTCNVPAAVCENRCEGADNLFNKFETDVVVLDDAYQHRWISRDINFLIFAQSFLLSEKWYNRLLLPSGTMRESFGAVKRADAVIINRKFNELKELPENIKKHFNAKKVFNASYHAINFIDVRTKAEYNIEDFSGQKSLLVSGIARPNSFINGLKKLNINTDNKIIFGDHKSYKDEEVQQIRKMFYSTNSFSVITTEKDAVKLKEFSQELDDIDIYYLKIELKIDEENEFKEFIESLIN